jgi:hypothetical protein
MEEKLQELGFLLSMVGIILATILLIIKTISNSRDKPNQPWE